MAVRVTSSWIEVLSASAPPPTRVTSSAIQVLSTNADPPIRVTSSWIEVLHGAFPPIRVTSSWIEVLASSNPPDSVTFETDTGASVEADLEFPWVFEDSIGVIIGANPNFPWELATQVLLSAWSDGTGSFGPEAGDTASFGTVTGIITSWGYAPPTIAWYETVTRQSDSYNSDTPWSFETDVGVTHAHSILIDGRFDLIDTRLYKR